MNDSLAIIGGTIIDGTGGVPIEDGVLVIEGKRIVRVGNASTPVPLQATRVPAGGKFLIPGLMNGSICLVGDCSMPLNAIRFEGRYDELAIEAAQIALTGGLTTVFDSFGPREYLIKARDAINEGRVAGSRIYLSGNIVGIGGPCSNDFYPKIREVLFEYSDTVNALYEGGVGRELLWMSPDEFRAAIRRHAESGIDFMHYAVTEVNPDPPAHVVFSSRFQSIIVEEAHRVGIPVAGYVTSVEGTHLAIDAGVDLMQHIDLTGMQVLPSETIDRLVRTRIPTTIVANTNEALAWLRQLRWFDVCDRNQRALLRAGVPIVLATNGTVYSANTRSAAMFAGAPWKSLCNQLGEGHFNWLVAAEQKGMRAMDALVAATRDVARAYKVDKDLGTLEVGKIADLIILDKSPLVSAQNYRCIVEVVKDGRLVDRASLPNPKLLT